MYPFGVTFYPDQWPADSWEDNFRQIKAAGFNLVRFNEMAWDWVEPRPGKFHFSGLDRAMNLCAKYGLKVLLGIPTSQVPPWFYKLYPNSRPVAQDGTLYPEYGPRPNICKDNRHYRHLAERLAKKLVARYKNHPALAMWQVDNEPVYPPLDHTTNNDFCHCEYSRQAFINWAKKRYKTIEALNDAWGSRFWTTTFGSFEEIRTPKAGIWEAVSPHIFLDWFRFKTDSLKEWVSHLARLVRSQDKNHKIGTNGFIGICTRTPDHSLIPAELDWYGLDIYPKGGKMDSASYAFHLDLWRSFTNNSGAEFHLTELQGGQNVRWGSPEFVDGSELKGWVDLAVARGAQAILFHAWRPPLFGAETGGFGILRTDGSETKRLTEIKKIAKELQTSNFKHQNKMPISKAAIAYLHSSEIQSFQEQGPPRGIVGQWEAVRSDIGLLHGLMSIQGAHQVASNNGKVPVNFVFEQDLETGHIPYSSLLLPNPYLLSLKQYKNIKKWVSQGGTLITEARFGLKNEFGHLYAKPLIEDLLDVTYDHVETIKSGFLDVLVGKPRKEQVITKKVGRGKVVYANYSLFLAAKQGDKKALRLIAAVV